MADFYLSNGLHPEFVFHGAYLLNYDALASMPENDVLDRDDLLDLLVLLYRLPMLLRDTEVVARRLADQAVLFARELADEGRPEYVHYLLLIPTGWLVEEASTMITASHLLSLIHI